MNIGDRVWFIDTAGVRREGRITGFTSRYVTVRHKPGSPNQGPNAGVWGVHRSRLHRAED